MKTPPKPNRPEPLQRVTLRFTRKTLKQLDKIARKLGGLPRNAALRVLVETASRNTPTP